MAKIIPITEEELIAAVNEEGLGVGHPFETELDMGTATKEEKQAQIPGTIGVTRTASAENYLCYIVDNDHKMTKCSTHGTREEAYGMALRRYREFAKAENPEKPDGPSFHKGPISDPDSSLRAQMEERLTKTQSRKQFQNWYVENNENTLFRSCDICSTFRSTYYADEMRACIRAGKRVLHDTDMVAECVKEVLEEKGIGARDISVSFHDNHHISANFMCYQGCSDNWIEINYKADSRPKKQNYAPVFDAIETSVRLAQEAKEMGKDLTSALNSMEGQDSMTK